MYCQRTRFHSAAAQRYIRAQKTRSKCRRCLNGAYTIHTSRLLFFCVLCPNSVEYDVGYIFPVFYLSVHSAGVFLYGFFHIFHPDPIGSFVGGCAWILHMEKKSSLLPCDREYYGGCSRALIYGVVDQISQYSYCIGERKIQPAWDRESRRAGNTGFSHFCQFDVKDCVKRRVPC